MYCQMCGSQIEEGSNFCPVCGAALGGQPMPPQPPVAPQPLVQGYGQMPQQPQMEGYGQMYPQEPMGAPVKQKKAKTPRNSKKKKMVLGITIGVVVAAALTLLAIFVIIPVVKKATMSDQEKAVYNMIEALDNVDLVAYDKACLPSEYINDETAYSKRPTAHLMTFIQTFGFTRGFLENDRLRVDQEAMKIIYRDYPVFNPDTYGGREQYDKFVTNNANLKTLLKDLSVSYDLIDMANYKDGTLYRRDGLKKIEVEDIDSIVFIGKDDNGNAAYLDIDDLYVATVHITWCYGDLKYGINKDWWSYKALEGMTQGIPSYEEQMKQCDNMINYLLVYQYKGNWYVMQGPFTVPYYIFER